MANETRRFPPVYVFWAIVDEIGCFPPVYVFPPFLDLVEHFVAVADFLGLFLAIVELDLRLKGRYVLATNKKRGLYTYIVVVIFIVIIEDMVLICSASNYKVVER